MDTTPPTDDNPEAPPATTSDRGTRLEALAALDPAEAPVEAEALAAELANDLEGVSSDGAPRVQHPAGGRSDEDPS